MNPIVYVLVVGPLVPETVRSTGAKVFDALTGTTHRGANIWLAFSNRDRLALAVEETEDGPRSQRGVLGSKSEYAPLAIFEPAARPRLDTAEVAWPGSEHLPTDKQKPSVTDFGGQKVKLELVRFTESDDRSRVSFMEPEWVEAVGVWCSGGPSKVDPKFVEQGRPQGRGRSIRAPGGRVARDRTVFTPGSGQPLTTNDLTNGYAQD